MTRFLLAELQPSTTRGGNPRDQLCCRPEHMGKLQASCALDLLSPGRERSCRKRAGPTASKTFKLKYFQVNASGLRLLKTGQTCDSFPEAVLKFLVSFSSYWSWTFLCYFLPVPASYTSKLYRVWFSARTPESTHLGGFKLPAAPIHVDFVLPHEGKFPGAVHESRAQQAPLPQVQGLLNACRGRTQRDASHYNGGPCPHPTGGLRRCTSVGAGGYPTADPSHNVPRAIRRRGLYLLPGTSLSRAGYLQPRPSSSDRSGQHGAGPEAPGMRGHRVPAAGVEATSQGHSGLRGW